MGKDSFKNKVYGLPTASTVLFNATESHKAASIRHQTTKGGEYEIPDILKKFGYGIGKAYNDMSTGEKIVYGLALFAMVGVVADNAITEGKYTTKPAKDNLNKIYEKIVKKTPAGVAGCRLITGLDAGNASAAPTPAYTPPANGSADDTNNIKEPVKYTFNYNGITITGKSKQFIHDILLPLMYVEKVAPEYYPKCTTRMEEDDGIPTMNALFGHTSINSTTIRHANERIYSNYNNGDRDFGGLDGISSILMGHENKHNCDGPDHISQESADNEQRIVWEKLRTVPVNEKKKYLDEFEEKYNKIESQITTI